MVPCYKHYLGLCCSHDTSQSLPVQIQNLGYIPSVAVVGCQKYLKRTIEQLCKHCNGTPNFALEVKLRVTVW